jgi:hypothetical protein
MKLLLGCDPELFLLDAQGNFTASCGKIGGTKTHPMALPLGDGFAVQEDNVAMEFNVPPAADVQEFVSNIRRTMNFLAQGVKDMYGYSISPVSAVSFPEEELQAPAARVFGCDPDFNAWTGRKNPKPAAEDPNLRSCGGHVHIGFDKEAVDLKRVIKCCDLTLGVGSVMMDKGELRKQLYGKRGAYREKSFGGEYRVLSNFWVQDDRLIQWVWDGVHKAVELAGSPFAIDEYDEPIKDAIDNNNKEAAKYLINEHKLEVLSV